MNSKDKFKKYPQKGYGDEGAIYQINEGTVAKTFDFTNKIVLPNKFNKIKLLSLEKTFGIVLPKKIVINEFGEDVGYTMDLIKTDGKIKSFNDLDGYSKYSLALKIKYLLRLENIIKRAHEKGIIIVDISRNNLLIDDNDEINIIDVDNFQVGEYKADIVSLFPKHYQIRVSNIIDGNTDKYTFGIFVLELLTKGALIFPHLAANRDDDYLYRFVDALDVQNEVKNAFKELFSDKREKEYIGEVLQSLSNEETKTLTLKRMVW